MVYWHLDTMQKPLASLQQIKWTMGIPPASPGLYISNNSEFHNQHHHPTLRLIYYYVQNIYPDPLEGWCMDLIHMENPHLQDQHSTL